MLRRGISHRPEDEREEDFVRFSMHLGGPSVN